ncbi:MAG: VWA domain-containing protein, partial [Thermoanaerobaculia bacterium]
AASYDLAPPEQRLHVAVFVDDQSLTPPARNRLLPALRRFLGTELGRGDRLLLARYDGSLTVQQPPVGSSGAIVAALDAVGRGSGRGQDRRADLAHLLRELQDGQLPEESDNDHSEMDARAIYAGIRVYSQSRYDEARRTLAALTQVVDALAGLPGRKALLYLGGGLSLHPGEALFRAFEGKYGRLALKVGGSHSDILQHDATPLLRELAARANAGRVTIYAIGSPEDPTALALEQRLDMRALNTPSGGVTWSTELAATESFNHSQPLQMMAGPTGGVAAFDTPDPSSLLATVRRDLAYYYSLGFVPTRRNGNARRLEVRVKRPGLRVRHREGYREATGRERAARSTRSAVFLGWSENPLEAAVEVEGATPDGGGQLLVDVLVKVP